MKTDLKNLTRRQLERLRSDIDKALARLEQSEKKEALKAAEKAARAHGFSLDQLTGNRTEKPAAKKPRANPKNDGRSKVAPKYKNPDNAEQTWSGRGRAPGWFHAHLEAGGSRQEMEI